MSDKANAAHRLHREIEAAKVLLAQYEDILGEDAVARADMVEGETTLIEGISRAVARIIEVEAHMKGIADVIESLGARARRLKEQRDNLRTLVTVAMELGVAPGKDGKIRLETHLATLALKANPVKVVVTDEALIPAKYWKAQEPVLDKKALLEDLKAKEQVQGATLSNREVSLQIGYR